MKIKETVNTDGELKDKHRKGMKIYLDLCKKNLLPVATGGVLASGALIQSFSSVGLLQNFIFGGVTSTAFMLALNGIITGVKISKENKQQIKENIENYNEEKGKTL